MAPWREPLLHFLLAGAGLFALWTWVSEDAPRDDVIVVGPAEVAAIADQFEAQTSRPPTPDEIEGLVATWIREEVLYREALALGLDVRDTVVRRRMAQKLGFLLEGTGEPTTPDDETLRAWYTDQPEPYATPPLFTFDHVFFGSDRRANAEADARAALEAGGTEGDPFPLPTSYRDTPPDRIAGDFGWSFGEAIRKLEPGGWSGPIASEYGWHLVRVTGRVEGRIPSFEEVRVAVREDWLDAQREAATEAAYLEVRERYEVVVSP
jgi:hypothetical protein